MGYRTPTDWDCGMGPVVCEFSNDPKFSWLERNVIVRVDTDKNNKPVKFYDANNTVWDYARVEAHP